MAAFAHARALASFRDPYRSAKPKPSKRKGKSTAKTSQSTARHDSSSDGSEDEDEDAPHVHGADGGREWEGDGHDDERAFDIDDLMREFEEQMPGDDAMDMLLGADDFLNGLDM
jgi:hypothetical protein